MRPRVCALHVLSLPTLAALLGTLASLAFTAAPAGAAITHKLVGEIKEVPATEGMGVSKKAVPVPGLLEETNGLAVDSGHLFVAEKVAGDFRLDLFESSSGQFVAQLSDSIAESGPQTDFGVAVGHQAGKAFVYAGEERAVAVLGETGDLLATWHGEHTVSGSFGSIAGVAVDDSVTDVDAGDVYIAEHGEASGGHHIVDVFKPAVSGVEPLTLAGQITGPCATPGACPPGDTFSNPTAVAVDEADGYVLVADEQITPGAEFINTAVDVFKPAALPGSYEIVEQIAGPSPTEAFKHPIAGLAVDGAGLDNGDIYVAEKGGEGGESVDEFRFSGVAGESTEYVGRLTGLSPMSVAVDPARGDLFVGQPGVVDEYGEDLILPDVTVTEPVPPAKREFTIESKTHSWSTLLKGAVDPAAGGSATCTFEYGTSTSYGAKAECSGPGREATPLPEGDAAVPVQSSVTGLLPDTTYFYRLDGTNVADGKTNTGLGVEDEGEFTTPGPGIESESASDVASGSATLDATVNPHGVATSYYFEYGSTTAYGGFLPAAPGVALGSTAGEVKVEQHLQEGLAAGQTYHFRVVTLGLVEVSPGGESRVEEFDGPDETFTTQGSGSFVLPDGREWEMVSPPEKHGALLEPIKDEWLIQASAAGNALAYVAEGVGEHGAGALRESASMERGAEGAWRVGESPLGSGSGRGRRG
jgi:hypothetical protein